MSIRMDDSIRAVYYAVLAVDSVDWLLGINEEEDHYLIQYRFRYYNSDDPWDTEDKKNWYSGTVSKTKQSLGELIKNTNKGFEAIESIAEGDCYKLIRGEGTQKQFFAEFEKLPFVHKRAATAEERKKYADTTDGIT